MTGHTYIPRINEGGNFCGHDPLRPSFTLARPAKTGEGGIPRILTLCMERLKDYYDNPRKKIPSLDLANGSERQQRSERREACTNVLACLIRNTEVASLRVGVPTTKGFINFTVDLLARYAGLSLSRTERALRDLKKAGLVTVSQPRKTLENGVVRGLAAIKAISKRVFRAFGLAAMLDIERKKASKRLKAKQEKWRKDKEKKFVTETEKARYSLFISSMQTEVASSKNPLVKPIQKSVSEGSHQSLVEADRKKQVLLRMIQIKKQHPGWSREQCLSQAERQLQGLTAAS